MNVYRGRQECEGSLRFRFWENNFAMIHFYSFYLVSPVLRIKITTVTLVTLKRETRCLESK